MRTIAISGASGFVGAALAARLRAAGARVRPLLRPGRRAVDARASAQSGDGRGSALERGGDTGGRADDGIAWDPLRGEIDADALEGLDALVHLAGENLADGRWSEAKKARIRDSRVRGTELLASTLARLEVPPKVWLSGSAVGFYGDRADEIDETAEAGDDFLARVVIAWEAAARPAAARVRVVHPRLGVVLAPHGGALAKMLGPFKLGLGGKLGGGAQGMSWVSLEDALRALEHLIDSDLVGPVNVAAPGHVSNAEFTRALGAALHRPTVLGVPAPLARLAFGELADVALLSGVRAFPRRLLASGFRFQHPELAPFLAQALGRSALAR